MTSTLELMAPKYSGAHSPTLISHWISAVMPRRSALTHSTLLQWAWPGQPQARRSTQEIAVSLAAIRRLDLDHEACLRTPVGLHWTAPLFSG
jgi:hypothetical protein